MKRITSYIASAVVIGLLFAMFSLNVPPATCAQVPTAAASVYQDRVRFKAPPEAHEWRIEVFSADGMKLFSSGFVTSQAVDWNMQDMDGQAVGEGLYSYTFTVKDKNGKKSKLPSASVAITGSPQSREQAPPLTIEAASPVTTAADAKPLKGLGTVGQISKWTAVDELGDSLITQSGNNIGIGTTAPTANLHLEGLQPAASEGNGANADKLLEVGGGKGGDTTGAAGQTAGKGADVMIQAGAGGIAPAGSTNGAGGNVIIQPGAAGEGGGSAGAAGSVSIAANGGNASIGNVSSTLTVPGSLTVGGVITGNLSGNAATATNANHATAADTANNANTVTNGVVTTGSYADPPWITSLAGSKITGLQISESQVTNLLSDLASKATDSAIVHLTGAETITGAKIFNNTQFFSGSVGIGMVMPSLSELLHVEANTGAVAGTFVNNHNTNGNDALYALHTGVGNAFHALNTQVSGRAGFFETSHSNSSSPALETLGHGLGPAFKASNMGTGPAAVFAIGNVGIGTASPAQKLDVAGNINSSGSVTAASFSGNGAGNVITSKSSNAAGVVGTSGPLSGGVISYPTSTGVFGAGDGNGVVGSSTGHGIPADLANVIGNGVMGYSDQGNGIFGSTAQGNAVFGATTNGTGIYGKSINGRAGLFDGNVTINGNLTLNGSTNIASSVNHDSTLNGNGTAGSPLAVVSAPNGVVTTASYADPPWITSLAGSKIIGMPNDSAIVHIAGAETITGAKIFNNTQFFSGSVGIGMVMPSPSELFHVEANTGAVAGTFVNNHNTSGNDALYALHTGVGNAFHALNTQVSGRAGFFETSHSNSSSPALETLGRGSGPAFKASNTGTGPAAVFTIGNVGIGTASPTQKLDVAGNINSSGNVTAMSFSGNGAGLTGINATSLICTGCIGNTQLADASVTTGKIAGAAVGSSQLANGAVTSSNIAVPLTLSGINTPLTVNSSFGGNGIFATSNSGNGLYGQSTSGVGVRGESSGPEGVFGFNFGTGAGVAGHSNNGTGVAGQSNTGVGVSGNSGNSSGVFGGSNTGVGVFASSNSNDAVHAVSHSAANGVFAFNDGSGPAVNGSNPGSTGGFGVLGTGNNGVGVWGQSTSNDGVHGVTHSAANGVFGFNDGSGPGIGGRNDNGGAYGVLGNSIDGIAVGGFSNTGIGVRGVSPLGRAGDFVGNVIVSANLEVTGNISKGSGSFKIDHPLDPENKYLYHSFVESPDMMNIYNGLVVLNGNGEAVVKLPVWFEALNSDFRYQLTSIGAPGPNLYIAEEIAGNRFKIGGGQPGAKVSWQVTGIRQDAWAKAHRIPVEEEKAEKERGHYLHPELFGQPEEKNVEWARHPELMKQIKEQSAKATAPTKQ